MSETGKRGPGRPRKEEESPPSFDDTAPRLMSETRDAEDSEMDNVFADFPQNDNCIELWRILPQGGRPRFLEQLTPLTFSFAYVTEMYGGGRYIAKGKYKDGSMIKMPFEIEGDSIPVKRKIPAGVTMGQPGPMFAPPVFEKSGDDAKDFQTTMMAMLQTIVSQLQGSEMQMLEKMKIYKQLFSGPDHPEAPLDQALNMFKQGVELASMNGGGGGDSSNFWLMAIDRLKEPLGKIVDTIQAAVVQGKARPAQPAPASGPVPVSMPAATVGEEVKPPQGEPDMIMLFVRSVMPALVNGAAKNADPANYVDFLLDQVPAGSYDALRAWLLVPDCLEKLAVIEPGIRFQQEWWVSLRSGLLEALNEELGHAVRSVHPESNSDPATPPPPDSPLVS